MRDLTSVTVQGLYRMSGVSNDPQSRERVHIRMRSRRTWYNCSNSNSFPFKGGQKEEPTPAHPSFWGGKAAVHTQVLVVNYHLKAAQLTRTLRARSRRMCSKRQSLSHSKYTLNKGSGKGSAVILYSWGCQMHWNDTCSPMPCSLQQSPAQPAPPAELVAHCMIMQHCINWGFVPKASLVQIRNRLMESVYCGETLPFTLFHVLFHTAFPWLWLRSASGSHQVRLELPCTHAGMLT